MIYNIVIICITTFVAVFFIHSNVFAQHLINNNNSSVIIDYSTVDRNISEKLAETFFNKALKSQDLEQRNDLLLKSASQYYILSDIDKNDINPCIKLARIYDMQKKDNLAKAYFFRALGIDSKNPEANYYFGDFYFSRKNYIKALEYYEKAFSYGITPDENKYNKYASVYEHLGDLTKASNYYKRASSLKK